MCIGVDVVYVNTHSPIPNNKNGKITVPLLNSNTFGICSCCYDVAEQCEWACVSVQPGHALKSHISTSTIVSYDSNQLRTVPKAITITMTTIRFHRSKTCKKKKLRIYRVKLRCCRLGFPKKNANEIILSVFFFSYSYMGVFTLMMFSVLFFFFIFLYFFEYNRNPPLKGSRRTEASIK